MYKIEESACLSRWREYTVETCVLCAGLGLCALCIPSLLAGPLVVFVAFSLSRVAKVPSDSWLKCFLGGFGFAIISLIPLSLNIHLHRYPMLTLDLNGLRTGLLAFSRSTGTLSATLLLVFTTPFPRLVGIMKCLSIPDFLTDLLILVYRQIFLLDEISRRLRRSLTCRGGAGSAAAMRRSLSMGISALFIQSLQRAARLESGLASRGSCNGTIHFPKEKYNVNLLFLVCALILPLLLASVVIFGKVYFGY